MITGSINYKVITILNVYSPNNTVSKYLKQKLIKLQREMDKSTNITRGFHTPLSISESTSRRKISKDSVELNYTIHRHDFNDLLEHFTQQQNTHSFQMYTIHLPR